MRAARSETIIDHADKFCCGGLIHAREEALRDKR
jgi:hypothetical protein